MTKIAKIKTQFGKYWLIQFFIIAVLIFYSSFTTISLFIVSDNSNLTVPTQNSSTIVVSIIFESNNPQKVINWTSIVTEVKTNSTLFSAMNTTLKINGTYFGALGFLVTEINNLKSDSVNVWTFYYYMKGSGWIYSPIGVSHFILSSDYQIKWVYGPASV